MYPAGITGDISADTSQSSWLCSHLVHIIQLRHPSATRCCWWQPASAILRVSFSCIEQHFRGYSINRIQFLIHSEIDFRFSKTVHSIYKSDPKPCLYLVKPVILLFIYHRIHCLPLKGHSLCQLNPKLVNLNRDLIIEYHLSGVIFTLSYRIEEQCPILDYAHKCIRILKSLIGTYLRRVVDFVASAQKNEQDAAVMLATTHITTKHQSFNCIS